MLGWWGGSNPTVVLRLGWGFDNSRKDDDWERKSRIEKIRYYSKQLVIKKNNKDQESTEKRQNKSLGNLENIPINEEEMTEQEKNIEKNFFPKSKLLPSFNVSEISFV